MLQPERIHYAMQSSEEYGGKAASLARLLENGFHVPTAWVIPVRYCFERPELDLSMIESHYYSNVLVKFAVRSGAPVSMPGLMSTKLNVAFDEIPEAVKAVWDSWNTEHAVAYREKHGIPHDMGTAVIIQQMVDSIKYAGVCFTDDPENDPADGMYIPIVEYVTGTNAEGLVSGAVTPDIAEPGSWVYKKVAAWAKMAHSNFGPSDLEWVIDAYNTVYFVQQRALRYRAKPKVQPVIDTEGRELILVGRPIGASTKMVLRVRDVYNFEGNGEGLYVREFNPEYYPKMMNAAAILTHVGGATCHAAIIANEMGIPAISGITNTAFYDKVNGNNVLIDGATGAIMKAKKEDTSTVVSIRKETTHPFYRMPDFEVSQNNYRVEAILYRFYSAVIEHREGQISIEERDRVVGEIAKILVTYFFQATICEMRWMWNKGRPALTRRKVYSALARLGVRFQKTHNPPGRDKFVHSLLQPESLEQAIEIQKWVRTGFNSVEWGGAFGGPSWGRIAETALKYMSGEISATMFVDTAFNLQHNGGLAFDKFMWMLCERGAIMSALDAKRVNGSIKAVLAAMAPHMSYSIETDKEFKDQKSILPANVRDKLYEIPKAA